MSVASLVACLIGWNLLVLKWCDAKARGLPVDFPETGYKWNEPGNLAQKFYIDQASADYPGALRQLAQVEENQRNLLIVCHLGTRHRTFSASSRIGGLVRPSAPSHVARMHGSIHGNREGDAMRPSTP